jgi:hypothetical protein
LACQGAQDVGEVVRQRLPQPRQPLALADAAELLALLVGFKERLLHHVGGNWSRIERTIGPRR